MIRQSIAVLSLSVNPAINPRHEVGDVADLVAQIRQNGFIDPIWVRAQGDHYEIIDGQRRRKAVAQIAVEDAVAPEDAMILADIYDVTVEQAQEMALAADVAHKELSPADEATAFYGLKLAGLAEATIAARFAVSEKLVKQRIAIGSLPAEIIAALRQNKISLETAMAFTLSPSAERQLQVFTTLEHLSPFSVRRALTETGIKGSDKRAMFVGVDAYEAAGGTITRDLFESGLWFDDAALLDQLFTAKLHATAQGLKDEGWHNVQMITDPNKYRSQEWMQQKPKGEKRLDEAQQALLENQRMQRTALANTIDHLEMEQEKEYDDDRYHELENLDQEIATVDAIINALVPPPYTAAQMKKYHALVVVNHHSVDILRGLKKPDAKAKPKASDAPEAAEDDEALTPVAAETASYSDAVEQLLAGQAQYATKLAMATIRPALAARMGLAARVMAWLGHAFAAPFETSHRTTVSGEKFQEAVGPFLNEIGLGVENDPSFAELLALLETLEPEQITRIEAFMAADLFKVSAIKNPDVQFVLQAIDPDMKAEGFVVDEEFLKRLGKAQLVEVILDGDPTAKVSASLKKPDVLAAALAVAGQGWLPKQLRMPNYDGPGSAAWIEFLTQPQTEQAA